jgi:predicted aspartyl protease
VITELADGEPTHPLDRRADIKKAKVHTAIGEEHGYWLRVAELTVLGMTTPDFALTVFPLGHKDIDGLVGMNFLRHFNFEIGPGDRQIVIELIER